jgi:hypothetical protein
MKKTLNTIKSIIIVLSVYFAWLIIISPPEYSDTAPIQPIPFTILSIYIWNRLFKNK